MSHLLAQNLTLPDGTIVEGPVTWATNVGAIVGRALNYVFLFAGIGLLLMLLSAGFSYLTSAGDAKKLETAKQRLTYALVGFIVIFVAYWIVQLVGTLFGIEEFKVFQ